MSTFGIVETILGGLMSGLAGLFFWMFKRAYNKIDEIEDEVLKHVTDTEVRSIIDDKLAPLRTQHYEMVHRLNRLEQKIDHLITLHMKNE